MFKGFNKAAYPLVALDLGSMRCTFVFNGG